MADRRQAVAALSNLCVCVSVYRGEVEGERVRERGANLLNCCLHVFLLVFDWFRRVCEIKEKVKYVYHSLNLPGILSTPFILSFALSSSCQHLWHPTILSAHRHGSANWARADGIAARWSVLLMRVSDPDAQQVFFSDQREKRTVYATHNF